MTKMINQPTPNRLSRNLRRSALSVALGLCMAGGAQAQTNAPATAASDPAPNDPSTLDKITVTGSRIKRAQIEGPSPVTVISSEQMKKEGFVTVNDALKTLTQNFGSVQN